MVIARKYLKKMNEEISHHLQKIGQMVLLRRLIAKDLKMSARTASSKMYYSVENFNEMILNDVLHDFDHKIKDEEVTPLILLLY